MKQKLSVKYYNFRLVVYLLAISTVGILAIGSAKESVQSRQIMGLALGLFLMVVISLFDYGVILKLYWLIYLGHL
ncbi:MAG: rod shape-determining protein RodA, partial [Lachnospiraceae bacterium]|nr:rod shape-determining protein RodA [Lachnospiraceae bacterium]